MVFQMRKIIRLSFLIDNLIQDFKIPVLRRSNRRPDGAQPCKQHSDRALELMLLGDFETADFAGSKRRHSVPAPAGRRLRSLARQEDFSPAPPTIIRNLINYKSYEEITTNLLHAVIVKSFQVGYDAAGLGRLVRTMSIHLVKK